MYEIHAQKDGRKRTAHSYSKLSPRKAQPRSRSGSNDLSYTYLNQSLKSGGAQGASKDECDQNAWTRHKQCQEIESPESLYLHPALRALSRYKKLAKFCSRNKNCCSKNNRASFDNGLKDTRAFPKNDTDEIESESSELERTLGIENQSGTYLDKRFRAMKENKFEGSHHPAVNLRNRRVIPGSRCLRKDMKNFLALFNTDIYRIRNCKNDMIFQENKNTNSGATVTRKAQTKRDKAHHIVPQSQSSSPSSVKSNLSSEENIAYNPINPSCTLSRGKNRFHSGVTKVGVKAIQAQDKLQALETKQFWEKMANKLKPNEIAIEVNRKGITKLDAQKETSLDINSHASICRNNSKGNCSLETSSRRCRSTGTRPATKGPANVSPRGISVGASSSDEASKRRYRQAKDKSRSPGGRVVQIGKATTAKEPKSATTPSQSKNKSPILKKSPKTGNTPESTPSRGSLNKSKPGKGKRDMKKSGSAKGSDFKEIVPLTPSEICERCNKYRLDQEIGGCIPLDFSHVQHLEKLAQSVNEESTRQLLKTVTAIIEEKVCKQMFRCLMPCSCPGCKNRPNVCDSLDKFFRESSKGKRKSMSKGKPGSGKGGRRKSTDSPKRGKTKNSENSEAYESADFCSMPFRPYGCSSTACHFDKDCCFGRHGNHWNSTWSSSSMRMGWWPGNKARFSHFDRCCSNRTNDSTAGLTGRRDDLIFKHEMKRNKDDAGSNDNTAFSQETAETNDTSHNSICFTEKQNKRWANAVNLVTGQELSRPNSYTRPLSDIFRRYCTDSSTPCPHDGIKSSENMGHNHSLTTPSFYTESSKVRDHFMGCVPEKSLHTWGTKLIYGDEDSAKRLEAFEKNFISKSDKSQSKKVSEEVDSPLQNDSSSGKVRRRRFSPKKSSKKSGSSSKTSSPTTKVIGELEARTKALLCEAKLGICQENDSGNGISKPLSPELADSSALIREFSPIKPPDVNTAYCTNQSAQPVNKSENEFGPVQVSQPEAQEKQWWDGLPEKTTRTFNSVLLKKYSISSAMPVSVEAISKTQPSGTTSFSGGTKAGLQARSRSESRLTPAASGAGASAGAGAGAGAGASDGKSWGSARNGQNRDTRPNSARKTGSYTVCKGRQGKQNPKGKSAKKLWKY